MSEDSKAAQKKEVPSWLFENIAELSKHVPAGMSRASRREVVSSLRCSMSQGSDVMKQASPA
jgi:hypothetical protein